MFRVVYTCGRFMQVPMARRGCHGSVYQLKMRRIEMPEMRRAARANPSDW